MLFGLCPNLYLKKVKPTATPLECSKGVDPPLLSLLRVGEGREHARVSLVGGR